MFVLVCLYKVTVWLVTMVTHSLATDLIKMEKRTYFGDNLKENTKLFFLYEKDHIPCQYIKIRSYLGKCHFTLNKRYANKIDHNSASNGSF